MLPLRQTTNHKIMYMLERYSNGTKDTKILAYFEILHRASKNAMTPWFFKKYFSENWTDFSDFWCTESWRNITSDDHKCIHLTCKMQPLYLVKSK